MNDREKFNEVEYYTYIESILEHVERNIDDINVIKKENEKLKKDVEKLRSRNKIIIIIIFLILVMLFFGMIL